jgi:DNA-binding MarR family transcriptional regulator
MSTRKRDQLVNAIGLAIMRWQDATETFDETVGKLHDLNSADRRALSLVSQGPQTASAIAKETALTPAAVTALIDRLERRKLLQRRPDSDDRRKVMVEATDKARALISDAYGPIARAGAEMLARYSIQELMVIKRLVDEALALQQQMTEALIARERETLRK